MSNLADNIRPDLLKAIKEGTFQEWLDKEFGPLPPDAEPCPGVGWVMDSQPTVTKWKKKP